MTEPIVDRALDIGGAGTLDGFNQAMEDADRVWRLADVHPAGWVLIDDATDDELLDLADAQSEREAVLRAIAWLRSDGLIP